jgi:hypothetical protein
MKTLDNRSTKTGEPTTETDTDGFKDVLLSPWHEIVGKCIDIHQDAEEFSLTLKVNGQALKVVIPALNQDSFPSQFIGKRIGVLRTDDLTRPFVVREIRR